MLKKLFRFWRDGGLYNKPLSIFFWSLAILDFFASNAHAEPMSTAMALLYGSLAGGGMSALGSMFGGKSGTTKQGYDIVKMPQYSWTEPNRKLTADFLSSNLQRMSEGKLPTYMSEALPYIESGMRRPLNQMYMGRPGQRGGSIYDMVASAGAMGGLGGKSIMSQVSRASQDYADRSQAIDEYLANLKYQTMSRDALAFPEMLRAQPYGPETQIVSYGGTSSPASNPMGSLFNALGSAAGSYFYGKAYPGQTQGDDIAPGVPQGPLMPSDYSSGGFSINPSWNGGGYQGSSNINWGGAKPQAPYPLFSTTPVSGPYGNWARGVGGDIANTASWLNQRAVQPVVRSGRQTVTRLFGL